MKHSLKAIMYFFYIIIGLIINTVVIENEQLTYQAKHFISGVVSLFIYLAIILVVVHAAMSFFKIKD